ncbi:hypothetical protein [Allomuricauda sp. M10]|uniref:hypothetical protein n=1 Tax=Allomuricauda sp. M10 TaxID=2683292 RepID=UPI001D198927|nr:hypothetical protein [Muricauda sp. M10]
MKEIYNKIDFNFFFDFDFSLWEVSTFSLAGAFIYFLLNPEKFEKLIALLSRLLRFISSKVDRTYVKYDLQGKINDYLKKVSKRVKHIDIKNIKIEWIDVSAQTEKQYIQDGEMIIRLKKGDHQNENIVKASMAFISHAFLKKAKSYIAKYQRESMDLFACYDLLKEEKSEILDQFVQDFMKNKMDNEKIADFFEKYTDIDDVGIFYPVLVQELTFLGEKVFANKRDTQKIHKEVTDLVNFLYRYANRKLREDNINDFSGEYCKFGIRIIGRSLVINRDGERVYVNHLKKVAGKNETMYLIGNKEHKKFMKKVFKSCQLDLNYSLIQEETYKAIIKDPEGEPIEVKNYMMTIRNNSIKVYHKS